MSHEQNAGHNHNKNVGYKKGKKFKHFGMLTNQNCINEEQTEFSPKCFVSLFGL